MYRLFTITNRMCVLLYRCVYFHKDLTPGGAKDRNPILNLSDLAQMLIMEN